MKKLLAIMLMVVGGSVCKAQYPAAVPEINFTNDTYTYTVNQRGPIELKNFMFFTTNNLTLTCAVNFVTMPYYITNTLLNVSSAANTGSNITVSPYLRYGDVLVLTVTPAAHLTNKYVRMGIIEPR